MFGFGKRRVEKLDFLVAGAQKSGTTALNYYLKRHPRIALPVKKELHFFDNDELFAGGNVSYEPPVRNVPADASRQYRGREYSALPLLAAGSAANPGLQPRDEIHRHFA